MILLLHHRYRSTGGEERAVADTAWLVREVLGEDCEVLERDSTATGPARAARGLLGGGLDPADVAAAVRRTGARVVHAHNLHPTFGARALRAARDAGARVVLHLHNYRLVCAVGTCVDPAGADCLRCHGRNTLPGVRLNCRGSRAEAVVYGAALAGWQRAIVAAADVVVVPSQAAHDRLRELGAPLPADVRVVPHALREFAERSHAAAGEHALVASRLAPEKGVEVAVEACRLAGLPLVVCGAGPLAGRLPAGADYRGHVDGATLADLRARARVALVPSRAAETYGLAALEAMAAGVPVVASRVGALAELGVCHVPPGDAAALAAAISAVAGDEAVGAAGIAAARAKAAPEVVAPLLASVYDH